MKENLVNRSLSYKWFMHLIERGDVVKLRYYENENGRQILSMTGFKEEKTVVLARGVKRRAEQYHELCDWVADQSRLAQDSRMTKELKAAEAYAKAIGIDYERQPDKLIESLMEAIHQLRVSRGLNRQVSSENTLKM